MITMKQDEIDRRVHFIDALNANVNNTKLSDAEFRQFVKNSLTQFQFPGSKSSSDYVGPYGMGGERR